MACSIPGATYSGQGAESYSYDANGNRTRRTKISDGSVTDYVWDYRNRLVSVTQRASVGGAATKSVSYAYDVLDRMVSRTVDPDGAGPQAATTRYNVYDGQDQVLELTSTGSVQRRFLYGPAVDQVLAQEDSANSVRWMLADNEGTIRDVASYNSGTDQTTVVNHLKYDAYGNILSQTNAAEQPVFTYTGRFWDADAGLYYYRARWYDARVGRFLSDDPKGFAAGDPNLQRYVLNSPVNYTDPSGMDQCSCSTAYQRRSTKLSRESGEIPHNWQDLGDLPHVWWLKNVMIHPPITVRDPPGPRVTYEGPWVVGYVGNEGITGMGLATYSREVHWSDGSITFDDAYRPAQLMGEPPRWVYPDLNRDRYGTWDIHGAHDPHEIHGEERDSRVPDPIRDEPGRWLPHPNGETPVPWLPAP